MIGDTLSHFTFNEFQFALDPRHGTSVLINKMNDESVRGGYEVLTRICSWFHGVDAATQLHSFPIHAAPTMRRALNVGFFTLRN